MSYLNLSGTFYYLCSILDGYSCSIDHYEIREQMTEQAVGELSRADVEIIVQRALEAFPEARPRIISDNNSARLADHGPQFVAKDFKAFIRVKGITLPVISHTAPRASARVRPSKRTKEGSQRSVR